MPMQDEPKKQSPPLWETGFITSSIILDVLKVPQNDTTARRVGGG
jgi:hypothetical protein